MEPIEKEIKSAIEAQRLAAGLGRRISGVYPTETDFYLFLAEGLADKELERMLDHLKSHPEDQALVAAARKLLSGMEDAQKEPVPADLLKKVRSQIPQKLSASCPHCHRPITPFKKPLSRQKLTNWLWLAAGVLFFLFSFTLKRHFIQWVALGALCIGKWIVDRKSTKTQIMIYKALSGEEPQSPGRLELKEKNGRDAGI